MERSVDLALLLLPCQLGLTLVLVHGAAAVGDHLVRFLPGHSLGAGGPRHREHILALFQV